MGGRKGLPSRRSGVRPAHRRSISVLKDMRGRARVSARPQVPAVPVVLGKLEEPEVIRDLVSALVRESPADPVGKKEAVLRRVACRGAIKAGDHLSREQMRRLLDQLARTKNPYTCPHGRPKIVSFSPDELAAMFRRP